MKEGDNVRVRGTENVGRIRRVSDRKVEVMWILGSGWKHIVEYDVNELEGV